MDHGCNIIAGNRSSLNKQCFKVLNPRTSTTLGEQFFCASSEEINLAISSAEQAYHELLLIPRHQIALFLQTLNCNLAKEREAITERCFLETALDPQTRINPEFDRMLAQLTMFAELIDKGIVADCKIAPALPFRKPKPRPDLRRVQIGIGTVVVVEPSNFPLAFGASGSDTASAWAAGCPVIVKSHPLHAGTSELVGTVIANTIADHNLPPGMFSLLHGAELETISLVQSENINGVSFTGSRKAGKAILDVAQQRKIPLSELSLEMGSCNPVFIFPGALQNRSHSVAELLTQSALAGGGQFCTKPGIFFTADENPSSDFLNSIKETFRSAPTVTLLSLQIANSFRTKIKELEQINGVKKVAEATSPINNAQTQVSPTALAVKFNDYLATKDLYQEVFGPYILIVYCNQEQMFHAATQLEGELTATIHFANEDIDAVKRLCPILVPKVGRLVFNGVPTGVEVCEALNHGGVWPAAYGRFSVTGPDAVRRWLRPICYQDAPNEVLPEEVKCQ